MYVPKIPQNNLTEDIRALVNLCKSLADKHYFLFNPPAKESEIAEWETKNKIKIPQDYKDWLRFSNGSTFERNLAEFYSINQLEIYNNPDYEDYVIIGSIIGDGETLCFSRDTGKIFRDNHGEISEYPSFKNVLEWVCDNLQEKEKNNISKASEDLLLKMASKYK
ncbi:MAG: SMI1/KNR4 family protein [Oscillospiraceae bacterium]|jgi:hypothetical protein|nr:SMI1/KNR4 family protein [Oscillospiraceae bacterium]